MAQRSVETSRTLRLAALVLVGCSHGAASRAASPPVTAPTPPASTTVEASAGRCAVVPLRLMLRPTGHAPSAIVTLAADGGLAAGLFGELREVARLDARGCLVAGGDTWVEVTPRGDLWTPHESLRVAGGALQIGSGRAMRIEPDGRVQTLSASGAVEPETTGTLSFEGFSERGRCAAYVLLATFLGMMPSMAVSDGHPHMEPPPDASMCPHPAGDAGASGDAR